MFVFFVLYSNGVYRKLSNVPLIMDFTLMQ